MKNSLVSVESAPNLLKFSSFGLYSERSRALVVLTANCLAFTINLTPCKDIISSVI